MADPSDKHGNRPGRAEPYQVVARRFRPKAFDEVVGQDAIQATLKAELEGGRVPHAFLFAGSRGVGKTTTARILARCLNCEQGPTPAPCGQCTLCVSVLDGSNPDVVEMDAASHNGVDDMRALRDRIAFAPMMSRYKVFILDEAHMLSKSAWNALLKTLEEPPPGVVFVLATTELHKVPDTIRSRCQVLQFRRIGDVDIQARLRMIADKEGVAVEDAVLTEIAAASRGGMRDAETALEQALQLAREHDGPFDLAAYRELTQHLGVDRAVEVVTALLAGDAGTGLRFCLDLERAGGDEREALGDLVDVLRAVLVLQIDGADSGLVSHVGAVRERLQALAQKAGRQQIEAMIQAGVIGRDRLRRLEDRAAILELTVVRMAEAGTLPSLAELVAGVRDGAPGNAAGVAAPVRAPVAAAVAPSAAGPGDLRRRVLDALREQPLLAATMELCTFTGPDADGRVTIALDTDKRIYRDRLQAPALQQQVQTIVQSVLGKPANVQFTVVADRSAAALSSAPPPGETTKRVLSRFGGRVVAVNPDDKPPASPAPEPGPAPEREPDPPPED